MNVPIGTEDDPRAPWNAPEEEDCWNCDGTGVETNLVHVSQLVGVQKEEDRTCSVCEGRRTIPKGWFRD